MEIDMDRINLEAYDAHGPSPALIRGEVAGVALPFDVSDERPGLWFDDADGLVFFNYSVYDLDAFAEQLAEPDFGGRVRFRWQRGLEGGLTTIPVGNVLSLTAAPAALMFRARLNETSVADELRKALSAESVKETSVQVEALAFEFPTDDDGEIFRKVTVARIWDVSLVALAQFSQARLLEVFCKGCGSPNPHLGTKGGHTKPVQDDRKTPTGNGASLVSVEQLGNLYARINDLQEELRLQSAKSL